jgi:CDGSH-type Zn-finger protein
MTTDASRPQITPSENGPYLVSGSLPVRKADGTPAGDVAEMVRLCRCGGSGNKPFCDGTHRSNGFDGTEVADRGNTEDRREVFQGEGIAIYDDRSICAHIGNCTDNLAKVFKLGQEPWIAPSAEAAEAIARVIATCPSGALSYALSNAQPGALAGSGATVEDEHAPGVTASANGPYFVVGNVPVTSPDGTPYEVRARFALCRCGGTGNKPFCDGTHWSNGFKA